MIIAFECEKCGQSLKTAQGYERHINHCNRVYNQPYIKNKIKLTKNERKATD